MPPRNSNGVLIRKAGFLLSLVAVLAAAFFWLGTLSARVQAADIERTEIRQSYRGITDRLARIEGYLKRIAEGREP